MPEPQDLPIDIHLDKLIEWLESRNKLDKALWPKEVKQLKPRTKKSVKKLPSKIRAILEGSTVDYFTVLKVISMLEKAKQDSGEKARNFFGGASDETLQAWDEIAKAYKKNNIYLADCASIMMQNTNFEIPTLKKTLETSEKQMKDLTKKAADTEDSAAKFRVKFSEACSGLALDDQGDEAQLRAQLVASASQIQTLLGDVSAKLAEEHVGTIMGFYQQFTAFTRQTSGLEMAQECLPALVRVRALDHTQLTAELDQDDRRQAVTTDLMELEGFLTSRVYELSLASGNMTGGQFTGAPAIVQSQSKSTVEGYLARVQAVLAALRGERLQQLLLIRKSERYVDRVLLAVMQHLHTAKRLESNKSVNEARMEELKTIVRRTRAQLSGFTTGTKELKSKVEEALSKEYNGRKINIFGDISAF